MQATPPHPQKVIHATTPFPSFAMYRRRGPVQRRTTTRCLHARSGPGCLFDAPPGYGLRVVAHERAAILGPQLAGNRHANLAGNLRINPPPFFW